MLQIVANYATKIRFAVTLQSCSRNETHYVKVLPNFFTKRISKRIYFEAEIFLFPEPAPVANLKKKIEKTLYFLRNLAYVHMQISNFSSMLQKKKIEKKNITVKCSFCIKSVKKLSLHVNLPGQLLVLQETVKKADPGQGPLLQVRVNRVVPPPQVTEQDPWLQSLQADTIFKLKQTLF